MSFSEDKPRAFRDADGELVVDIPEPVPAPAPTMIVRTDLGKTVRATYPGALSVQQVGRGSRTAQGIQQQNAAVLQMQAEAIRRLRDTLRVSFSSVECLNDGSPNSLERPTRAEQAEAMQGIGERTAALSAALAARPENDPKPATTPEKSEKSWWKKLVDRVLGVPDVTVTEHYPSPRSREFRDAYGPSIRQGTVRPDPFIPYRPQDDPGSPLFEPRSPSNTPSWEPPSNTTEPGVPQTALPQYPYVSGPGGRPNEPKLYGDPDHDYPSYAEYKADVDRAKALQVPCPNETEGA